MTGSLIFSAIAAHHSKLDEKMKNAVRWGTNVHQVASLGFILLALDKSNSWMQYINMAVLTTATILFPGVIYYQNIVKKGEKGMLSRFVPHGGGLHMVFWVLLAT